VATRGLFFFTRQAHSLGREKFSTRASITLPRRIASANSGVKFPGAVPGIVLDPVVVGSQAAGTTLYSRSKVSTAPLQPIYDATNGPITYGFDPL